MIYRLTDLKRGRSQIVLNHALKHGLKRLCLFSSGESYEELSELAKPHGIEVKWIHAEDRYYTVNEVEDMYPEYSDVTCGVLSESLMKEIGKRLYRRLIEQGYGGEELYVPVGSGETITALGHYIPHCKLIGYHSDEVPAIRFDFSHLKAYVTTHFKLVDLDSLPSIMWTLT